MAEWTLEQLIDLYSRVSPEAISESDEYRALCGQYAANTAFQAARKRVEEAAVFVQATMEAAAGASQEIVSALRLLLRTRSVSQDLELYHDLISSRYRPNWSLEQQAHFDKAYKNLALRYDFFFSFTNRYEQRDGENPVNTMYKHFILKVLTPDEWKSADRKKENLLARAIYTVLCRAEGHVGYFFPDTQYDNSVTEDKLRERLQDSFVFIQLVQNVMFRPPAAGTNYCHWEYSLTMERLAADHGRENRILFALAERDRNALLASDRVHPQYDRWHKDVLQRDPPSFPEADDPRHAHTRFREITNLVERKLAEKIDEAWDREIESVPS